MKITFLLNIQILIFSIIAWGHGLMKPVPEKIKKPFVVFLDKKNIVSNEISHYCLKWLKYYLDFCEKYFHPASSHESLSLFKNKLNQKKQTEKQIEQAQMAITFSVSSETLDVRKIIFSLKVIFYFY